MAVGEEKKGAERVWVNLSSLSSTKLRKLAGAGCGSQAMTKIAKDALKWGSLCTRSGPENLVVPEIIITFVSDSQ